MGLLTSKVPMDSKKDFLKTIKRHYLEISNSKITDKLIDLVSANVTNHYYNQYLRFREQYPKSIKRYSTFQIKDLQHPHTFEIVIKTLKEEIGSGYEEPCSILLNLSKDELKDFEKNRDEFYKMF